MRGFGRLEELMVEVDAQSSFAELSLLELYGLRPQGRQSTWVYEAAKRGIDICGALVGLIVLGLLFPIVALLFLLEDRGPIFYKQQRLGKDFQTFTLYKLRTMIVDADGHLARRPELLEAWRRTGKLQNDPRVTRLGSFLRRTSIDELPQLFNVLRGDISLIGPRPIQFSEIPAFGELIKLRQTVKPGLTGLWQVSGRSNTDYEQRAILDCIYVMDRSFWIDMLIIINTLPVVLHGWGAY